jgi:hypothetical protein
MFCVPSKLMSNEQLVSGVNRKVPSGLPRQPFTIADPLKRQVAHLSERTLDLALVRCASG